MENNNLEEVICLQRMLADLTDFERQQAKEDLEELQGKTKNVSYKAHVTVKSLRKAADKLDAVWKDCKIAHACGTTAGIVGGILTIGGGLATIMTAGMASPLLLLGMGVGAGGAVTNLGTSFVEASINSTEITKAEKDLEETSDCINNLQKTVQSWLDRKEEARLLYTFCLAMRILEPSDPVITLLLQVIFRVTNIPPVVVEAAARIFMEVGRPGAKAAGEAVSKAVGQAGAKAAGKASAKAAGKAGAKAAGKAGAKAAGKAGAKAAGQAGAKAAGKAGAKAAGKAGAKAAGEAGAKAAGKAGAKAAGKAGAKAAGKVGAKAAGEAGAKAAGKAGARAAGEAGAKAAGEAGAKAAGKAGARAAGKAGAQTAGEAGAQAAGRAGAQAAGDFAESGAKAGAKAGSKLAGGLIIGVSAIFLVVDAVDLGFTIRDLVENKGSEAASYLREKADELEQLALNN